MCFTIDMNIFPLSIFFIYQYILHEHNLLLQLGKECMVNKKYHPSFNYKQIVPISTPRTLPFLDFSWKICTEKSKLDVEERFSIKRCTSPKPSLSPSSLQSH